ncbi:tyrosine--tRNA ligase [Roseospirillum parvum]|uniref:Tyrosine--tRNA ligase n=1 Tax=Roseospirillum parvum TaxID=83401 RepID=A0A1G7XVH4_9PROT|nr:tyrosine--tRNA ligase [Roseospirillum parvum]SDG88202.1 tyrosyl-tRNA synthetase [Roseospirillum parvum]
MTEPAFTPASAFLGRLVERGYLNQGTDLTALDARLVEVEKGQRAPLIAYIGFDCTAESLHVGSLIQIMLLRHWQQCGQKPIVLMGGGTTRIGDPSFRDDSRPLLDDATIERNMAGIRRVFERFLTFGDGPTDAIMVNNADWLDELAYIPFLRDYGRHFTINRMLSFDSVRLRLEREQPLTFLEFNYMILQAYDFVELARRHGCSVQMGGSDQWGNIVNGVELGRRTQGLELFGVTSPLLTTASGAKMGKTAQGAVWLNPESLSPYDYWQYWRNTEDADVGRFLRLFTDLPEDEIGRLESLPGAEINQAKKLLADHATTLCHGAEAAAEARHTAETTFEQGGSGEALPTVPVPRAELGAGIPAYALMVTAGLAGSNKEARRLIAGGGGRLNGALIEDANRPITIEDLDAAGQIKLSAGKKRHALVIPA